MDLFAFAEHRPPASPLALPAEPRRPTLPVPSLPTGAVAWERILARLATPRLTVVVSALWTGEVLEVASDPAMGRRMLMRDGTVRDLPPDSAHGRIAYLTAARAQDLHRRHGLALIGTPGTVSARFRFAAADTEATAHVAAILARLADRTPT